MLILHASVWRVCAKDRVLLSWVCYEKNVGWSIKCSNRFNIALKSCTNRKKKLFILLSSLFFSILQTSPRVTFNHFARIRSVKTKIIFPHSICKQLNKSQWGFRAPSNSILMENTKWEQQPHTQVTLIISVYSCTCAQPYNQKHMGTHNKPCSEPLKKAISSSFECEDPRKRQGTNILAQKDKYRGH